MPWRQWVRTAPSRKTENPGFGNHSCCRGLRLSQRYVSVHHRQKTTHNPVPPDSIAIMPLLFSRRGNSGFFHLVSQNPLTDAQGLRRLCLHPVMGPECGNHHLFFQAGQALLQQTGIRSFFKDLRRQVIPSNHIAPYQGAQALDQMFQFPDIPPPLLKIPFRESDNNLRFFLCAVRHTIAGAYLEFILSFTHMDHLA